MGTNEKGGNSQLLESVLKAKNWPALADLKNGTPSGRRAIVTNVFEEACVHHDDEVALQWFNWLLLAITEEGEPNLEPVETTDWKAQDETKARLVCRQAEAIKALYPELPRFREEPARYAGESGAILSTLLKTKKAMLETIAVGWRAAPTNEAGDEFFTFISKTDSTLRDGVGDRELINETIRRVTGSDFPLTRLMYTLRNHPGAYTDILAHAWVKNAWRYGSRGSSSSLILAAVGDFYEASPEATKLLERVGAKILTVDRQLRGLNDSSPSVFAPTRLEFVYDDDNLEFDEVLTRFEVVVHDEKDFHQQFELIRGRILEAKRDWSVPIKIRLRGKFTFRYKHQITCPRTEDL